MSSHAAVQEFANCGERNTQAYSEKACGGKACGGKACWGKACWGKAYWGKAYWFCSAAPMGVGRPHPDVLAYPELQKRFRVIAWVYATAARYRRRASIEYRAWSTPWRF